MPQRPTAEQAASFPSRLKFLRETRGWGVNELAEKSELGSGTVSRLESGERGKAPQAATIRALARALKASADWLLDGTSEDGRIFNEDPLPGHASAFDRARIDAQDRRLAEIERKLRLVHREEPIPESSGRKRPSGGHKVP